MPERRLRMKRTHILIIFSVIVAILWLAAAAFAIKLGMSGGESRVAAAMLSVVLFLPSSAVVIFIGLLLQLIMVGLFGSETVIMKNFWDWMGVVWLLVGIVQWFAAIMYFMRYIRRNT